MRTLDEVLKEIEEERKNESIWKKAWRQLRRLRHVPDRVVGAIQFWWQRRTRGWSDDEIWSLDYTIAKFVLPRLRGLREVKQGVPFGAYRPEDLKTHEISEEAQAYAEANWDWMLGEMIFAFEFTLEDCEWRFDDAQRARRDVGMKLFAEHFGSLWW